MKFQVRQVPPRAQWALQEAGVHPLLARLYAARGVHDAHELDHHLRHLLPPGGLLGVQRAATLLADAMAAGKHLCIVADYDCDGATACAVGLRGLRLLGARRLSYVVPNRMVDGYGLTAAIAERVAAQGADLLITVDNGIASVAGVARAQELGLQVLVTDHHLPGATLPTADAIVNPNQPGCAFASKSLAGVGVMFYVLMALRAELRRRGAFDARSQPRLDALLPLVALGTVADVVPLDANNRRLVAQGLQRIRTGHLQAGLRALYQVNGREWQRASTSDFGFTLGPRINAAGRMADMTLGIEMLCTDDAGQALELAQAINQINQQRREVESGMREQAEDIASGLFNDDSTPPPALSVYDPAFHEGVVGIVASRIKERWHRPTFVFARSTAPGSAGLLKGSGRSVPGFHLRDALDWVAKQHPGLLQRFGGHAMAAGCTIAEGGFDTFRLAFEQVAHQMLDPALLQQTLHTDGALPPDYRRLDVADTLRSAIWGQGFAAPLFSEELEVTGQRIVGEHHLALELRHRGDPVRGIWFFHTEPLPARALLAWELDVNEWRDQRSLQFIVRGAQT